MDSRHDDLRVHVFLKYMYLFTLATTITHGVLAAILRDNATMLQLGTFFLASLPGVFFWRLGWQNLATTAYLVSYYGLNVWRACHNGMYADYAIQFLALYTLILCLRLPRPAKLFSALVLFGTIFGLIFVQSLDPRHLPESNAINLAHTLMNLAIGFFMITYTIYCFIMLSDRSEQRLRVQADTDGLTGVLNRRAFTQVFEQQHYACTQEDKPLAVVLLDLDHFKNVNDTHGHLAGDKVLKTIASLLHTSVRKDDAVGRYGGEEFVLVLPNCPIDRAQAIGERIRESIARTAITIDNGATLQVTVSLGIARRRVGDSPTQLLAAADELLYKAKQSGRNRVEYA